MFLKYHKRNIVVQRKVSSYLLFKPSETSEFSFASLKLEIIEQILQIKIHAISPYIFVEPTLILFVNFAKIFDAPRLKELSPT